VARFCPICGKPETIGKFAGEICSDCAICRLPPLKSLHISVCQKCGHVLGKKNRRKSASLESEISRLLKISDAHPQYSEDFKSVEYDTPYGRASQALSVILNKRICTECGRAASQYFEAIIQLRGDGGKVERMAEKLLLRVAASKVEMLKEGIDIYCQSRSEAISALNSYRLGFLRTEKLAGERNGKRLYRTTLCVRL
jgi:NMD protein affecting ribosome stability and mRNA decay